MELEIKRPDRIVPNYSLTGDLLSYLRCRLQYRYHNGSSLPPSRPVQLWFGEFLHGTLELAFRFWEANHRDCPFPWPCNQRHWGALAPTWEPNDIGQFGDLIESALRRQGKQARSADARDSAYRRVALAINTLGPHLFPLIASAETRVIGTRPVPDSIVSLRCSNYEVHGIIDVLTNITLGRVDNSNLIRDCVRSACPGLDGDYEVIVDYKGSQRPRTNEPFWIQGDWQIHTYAWLRSRQSESLPVAAGILIYVNELTPGGKELQNLRKGISEGTTDVLPRPGSSDEQLIRMWRSGSETDQLSLDFRLRHTLRVVPVTPESTQIALSAFDDVVGAVEQDIFNEAQNGDILCSWKPVNPDEDSCSACDFRHFCPRPAGKPDTYTPKSPKAP